MVWQRTNSVVVLLSQITFSIIGISLVLFIVTLVHVELLTRIGTMNNTFVLLIGLWGSESSLTRLKKPVFNKGGGSSLLFYSGRYQPACHYF